MAIRVADQVLTNGGGSHGIYAESTASVDGKVPLQIAISVAQQGVVQGGKASGSSSIPDGVGVYVATARRTR